jgi:hypothetical protein
VLEASHEDAHSPVEESLDSRPGATAPSSGGALVRVDSTAAIDDVVDRIMGYLSRPV